MGSLPVNLGYAKVETTSRRLSYRGRYVSVNRRATPARLEQK